MIDFPEFFTSLESERLLLKEISINDLEFLFEIRNNEENNKFIGRKKSSLEDVERFIADRISDFIARKGIIWMICNKDTNRNVGSVCYWNFDFEKNSAEIGYELASEFQGKGFMQEALSKVINFGFNELNLQTVEAFTHIDNKSSINVLQKYNFTQNNAFEPEEDNLIMFELTRTQL